jgi:murein L,D-transpeptidase YafK
LIPPQTLRRRLVPLALIFVVVSISGSGIAMALMHYTNVFGDPETRAITATRIANYTRASRNLPLPGTPDLKSLDKRLSTQSLAAGAPVLVRIFKREFQLELWMMREGRYELFSSYPICRWSGQLGPKLFKGDKQAPEGFYEVSANQMNPHSRWHRSFNVGFPNAFDQAHGRTGSALMVHGGCSSAGCYAMTNGVIDEIWQLTLAALSKGQQKRFQVQVFPFRMTENNLANHSNSPYIEFWRQLKQGSDLFEHSHLPPRVSVCGGNYHFDVGRSLEVTSERQIGCTPSAAKVVARTK